MLSIGLTGGIGAGKSSVAEMFADLGAASIDADVVAREVVEPGTPGLAQVTEQFGADLLRGDGTLDRAGLARIVFADAGARQRLNAIVHPLVARRTEHLMTQLPDDAIVVHDVPLIVENDLGANYHLVVVIGASEQERLRRLMSSRSMAQTEARERIGAQASDEQRRRAADIWIDNERPLPVVAEQVADLWRSRLVPFAANIASNTPAVRTRAPAQLTDPPPGSRAWPVQAERLLARIRRAAGDRIVTADHIGSTAIPGLPAKDVIDLQLGVADLAAASTLDEPLRQAGFILKHAVNQDHPKPSDPDPAQWTKRYYGSADPGRTVNLHVRQADSPGWRYGLAFRDWLADDAASRGDYLARKQQVAAATHSTTEYAEAKEPWFTEVAWPRLQDWIARTGWRPSRD